MIGYWGYLVAISILLLSQVHGKRVEPIAGVARPNFGVDFNFMFQLNNMHGTWKHAWKFDISMLDRNAFPTDHFQCFEPSSPLCTASYEFFNQTTWHLSNLVRQSGDKHEWLRDPKILSTIERTRRRGRRSLFPFVGDIEHFLFGVSTENEYDQLKKTLHSLTKMAGHTADQVTQLGENLASISKVSADVVKNSKEGIQKMYNIVTNITHDINDRMRKFQDYQMLSANKTENIEREVTRSWLLVERIFATLISVLEVIQADTRIMSGIQTALQGYIPIEWVPPSDLGKGLRVAEEGLKNVFPEATLTHSTHTLGYYYTHKIVTPLIKEDQVILLVDIPVNLGQQTLYVYALRKFPVILTQGNPYLKDTKVQTTPNQAVSILDVDYEYFLISSDGEYYSTATSIEVSLCQGELIRDCPKQFALYSIKYKSCLQALWNDSPFNEILHRCPYRLAHLKGNHDNEQFVQIIPLSNGRWYIDAPLDEKWIIMCPQRAPEIRTPCTSCVIQVDCGCGVKSHWFTIPTRLASCDDLYSPLTNSYSINPFQYKSDTTPWIMNLTGSDSFTSPPLTVPDITIPSDKNWNDVMESMDMKQYDLNRLYQKQMNQTKMYRTSSEALLSKISGDEDILTDLSNWPHWLTVLASILTFSNSAIIILICYCLLSRGAHASLITKTWDHEEMFLPSASTETLISLDVIILIIVSLILALQLITTWPIITQWLESKRWYRQWRAMPRTIKACEFTARVGQQIATVQGLATFRCEELVRQLPVLIGISGVPPGTHMTNIPAYEDQAHVRRENGDYIIELQSGFTIITGSDVIIDIKLFGVSAIELHDTCEVAEKYELTSIEHVKFQLQVHSG